MHASTSVALLPSSQVVPSVTGGLLQVPVVALHIPAE
jgi:hypothetical protein